mgnify:CR=1 FL=1|jgi:hypothetical protein
MSFLLANTLLSCQSQQPTTPEERDEDVDGHYVVMMNPRTSQDTHIEVQGVFTVSDVFEERTVYGSEFRRFGNRYANDGEFVSECWPEHEVRYAYSADQPQVTVDHIFGTSEMIFADSSLEDAASLVTHRWDARDITHVLYCQDSNNDNCEEVYWQPESIFRPSKLPDFEIIHNADSKTASILTDEFPILLTDDPRPSSLGSRISPRVKDTSCISSSDRGTVME